MTAHPIINEILWSPTDVTVLCRGSMRGRLTDVKFVAYDARPVAYDPDDPFGDLYQDPGPDPRPRERLSVTGLYRDNKDLARSADMLLVDWCFVYPEGHSRHLWCRRRRITHDLKFGDAEPLHVTVLYEVLRSRDDCRCPDCACREVMES